MPDDHSKVAPLLPIPNRTVKRLCADDSADSRVKVGHRQALTPAPQTPLTLQVTGVWALWALKSMELIRESSRVHELRPMSLQCACRFEFVEQAIQFVREIGGAVLPSNACEIVR